MSDHRATGRPGLLLIAPAAGFVGAVVGGALLLAISLSLTDSRAGSLTGRFVGGENFRQALSDPAFRTATGNTLVVSLVAPLAVLPPAVFLAHFLARSFRGRGLLLTLILLPWAAPVALTAMAWRWILDPLFSVVNWGLRTAHLTSGPGPQWLGNPRLALISLISVHAWRLLPFTAVVALAALSAIPRELSDAAAVDGAGGWSRFRHVTLPFLLPAMTVATLLGIVFTAGGLAVVQVLTQGGPFNSTQVTSSWAYQVGISSGALGRGAAISVTLLPILAAVGAGLLGVARRRGPMW